MTKASLQFSLLIVFSIIIFSANVLLKVPDQNELESVPVQITSCQLDQGDCSLNIGDHIITVSTEGVIKPLTRFFIVLSDKSSIIDMAEVSLTMKRMDMGKNNALFNQITAGKWKTEVVIPICTTGRNDWNLRLKIQSAKKLYQFDLSLLI